MVERMNPKKLLMIGVAVALAGVALAQQTDTPRPQKLRVSQEIMSGFLIRKVEPLYPSVVRAKGLAGQVLLKVVIDKRGQVVEVTPIQHDWTGREAINADDPQIEEAAVNAVKQWRYFSYELNGDPIEVETSVVLPFDFVHDQPQEPGKLRVSQGVMDGNSKRKVEPIYPAQAKANRVQGIVLLQATINRRGDVSDLKLISGHPLLAEAAMNAVKQWKYVPLTIKGQPVEVETTIKVEFHL
jgi:TonB family protein